ncbi:chloride channel protein [Pigmentiphaga sp. GD03639]|uniref:chloride channel protein n=1 Tax=Pigmentiphaga TaxID=152267 RepID=UPI000B41525C|nr:MULTISPECIES: chloride channel protein [unclassified Pigmentiphaga]MDH2237764.1 chloride channel protein [Pigmentiphaga sp. GD03639]OVZ62291.1 chloride channel protein EriC [Pigmentiphaga sp. NML030171]
MKARRSVPWRDQASITVRRKGRQVLRVSRKTFRYALVLCGAAVVALLSLAFAWLAEIALEWNRHWTSAAPWAALVVVPLAMAGLRWLTLRLAPMARGSGIPQVIAATSIPASIASSGLVSLRQALWKIPLTAMALLAGASVGREGPSVQVGAAAMLAWGRFWQERIGVKLEFRANELIAAGAAGGLAAAFNTPLAGVVFAIEELGRGAAVRWNRLALSGVLASGFIALAIAGNNPYFHAAAAAGFAQGAWGWTLASGVLNGAVGGLFAATMVRGVTGLVPARWRPWLQQHPVRVAFLCGLVVAVLGCLTGGATYGTGYEQTAALLNGHPVESAWFGIAKWAATIASYVCGIPGGIFTPSLAIGAGMGEHIVQLAGPAADPRTLALVSMAAFLAAATQAPITASVIVMEMTRSQDLMFHLLMATLVASLVSRQFCPRPFYHAMALRFHKEVMHPHHRPSAGPANAAPPSGAQM